MTSPTRTLAQQRRDTALAKVIARTNDTWRLKALRIIGELAETGEVFEAYDIVREGCPEPEHSAQWGGVLYACARAGLIVRAYYAPSTRPTVNGSACSFWKGAV